MESGAKKLRKTAGGDEGQTEQETNEHRYGGGRGGTGVCGWGVDSSRRKMRISEQEEEN